MVAVFHAWVGDRKLNVVCSIARQFHTHSCLQKTLDARLHPDASPEAEGGGLSQESEEPSLLHYQRLGHRPGAEGTLVVDTLGR